LNLRDNLKPNYGVNMQEGNEFSVKGLPYNMKVGQSNHKYSLREYKDKN
jgi:hypothetical protein